jgi:nucleotide-binding universal stress UspA family protein
MALGVRLARLASAPLEAVTIFPETLQRDDDLTRRLRHGAEAELRTALGRLEGAVAAGVRVLGAASPARALQRLSEDPEVGVVVIGSTTRGPVRRTLPGSIADRLLSGAASSIAIAPHAYADDAPPTLARVGVAYDASAEAQVALEGARRLARRAGARLRVITVHHRLAFGNVAASAVPVETVDETLEREARQQLDAAVPADGELLVERVFEIGRPVDVLVEHTRDLDLLMAGSRGYGPLDAVLLGSTTHDLARLAACPLLITPRGRQLAIV